jgi:hypothetical protein
MRNANAQRADTMIRVEGLQQPQKPHVSHAEIGGRLMRRKSGCERRARWRMIGFERMRIQFSAGFGAEILPKPKFG